MFCTMKMPKKEPCGGIGAWALGFKYLYISKKSCNFAQQSREYKKQSIIYDNEASIG